MTEGEVATSVDDLQPAIDVSDVTSPSRDCDDITDEDAFLAGFRDCRREALRYLRQRDAGVGDELERHLSAVERSLRRRSDGLTDGGSSLLGEDGVPADSDISPSRRRCLDGDDSALGVSLVDDDDAVTTDDDQRQSAMMSENACDLLRLAQNNPRINNVLNELFTLMDDDDDDDDCDCEVTCDDDEMTQEPSSLDVLTSHDTVSDIS